MFTNKIVRIIAFASYLFLMGNAFAHIGAAPIHTTHKKPTSAKPENINKQKKEVEWTPQQPLEKVHK